MISRNAAICYHNKSMRERATPTLSAIIVDDEPLASGELAFLLKDFAEVELLATGRNGLEGLELIERLSPDIAFLDVQMPGLDGVGLVRRLREQQAEDLPYFVFSTAFEQYAVEAFKLEALDYLLKPVDKDRLAATISRAQRYMQERYRCRSDSLRNVRWQRAPRRIQSWWCAPAFAT